ncbi:MAG TPA: hypothetical protein VGO92_03920 [Acidimicrobiales bacterium]|jgi:hypothetical protein|nr:hypothetical protein [Acidimicrobiales bacterium]
MPVVLLVDTPNMSAAQFDAVIADIGPELPAGCQTRIAGPSPDGTSWRVVSVWEDMATGQAFVAGTLRPAQDRAGIPAGMPSIQSWELHDLAT